MFSVHCIIFSSIFVFIVSHITTLSPLTAYRTGFPNVKQLCYVAFLAFMAFSSMRTRLELLAVQSHAL